MLPNGDESRSLSVVAQSDTFDNDVIDDAFDNGPLLFDSQRRPQFAEVAPILDEATTQIGTRILGYRSLRSIHAGFDRPPCSKHPF